MAQRLRMSTVAKQWGNLTQQQRAAWDQSAKTQVATGTCGNNINLTGQMLYMKQNLNLTAQNEAMVENPMASEAAEFAENVWGEDADFLADETVPTVDMPLGSGAEAGMMIRIRQSGPVPPGSVVPFHQLKIAYDIPLTAPDIAAGEISFGGDSWFEMFGSMTGTEGKRWYSSGQQFVNSAFSPPVILTTLVIKS
mgnify:CR=1 FL=1